VSGGNSGGNGVFMEKADYQAKVCQRLKDAEQVPFRIVSAEGWRPRVACCHQNVDYWVQLSPGAIAVRGWAVFAHFGHAIGLTAHSIVQGPCGERFDITPLADERARQALRFVEHLGSDQQFFDMAEQSKGPMGPTITCPELCGDVKAAYPIYEAGDE
jgi:hypothetical protein